MIDPTWKWTPENAARAMRRARDVVPGDIAVGVVDVRGELFIEVTHGDYTAHVEPNAGSLQALTERICTIVQRAADSGDEDAAALLRRLQQYEAVREAAHDARDAHFEVDNARAQLCRWLDDAYPDHAPWQVAYDAMRGFSATPHDPSFLVLLYGMGKQMDAAVREAIDTHEAKSE